MNATMNSMDLVKVDRLNIYSIESEDMIDVDGEIVTVAHVRSLAEGYELDIVNDFGEAETLYIEEDTFFDLYLID